MKNRNLELYRALCAYVDGRPGPAKRLGLRPVSISDAWRALDLAARQLTPAERARVLAEGRAQA